MASEQRIPESIRQEAARWISERDAGLLTAEDELGLAAWLDADPMHMAAYLRLESTWAAMGSIAVRQASAGRRAIVLPFPSRTRSRQWLGGAIAACLALVIMGGVNDWPTRLRADAMTQTGEQRKIILDDGSVVQLNTDSAITINLSGDRRIVHLLKGEAAFTVAADRQRPFIVEAADGATTALGTRFLVRRDGSTTDVAVTEHSVRVASPLDSRGGGIILAEGEATRYGANGLAPPHTIDPAMASAWTRGHLMFVDRPLSEVVAELNRYHAGYIRIVGDDLARRRFSGVFPVNDPMGAIDAIQRSLGIASWRVTDRLIFLHT